MTDPVSFGPDLADVFGPSQSDGGPDLVQLLTPEGERVHHPEFDHDFSAEELRGLYRDMVLTRRIDVEATALQRHGEETTEREVRWLTELIDAERRHPTDPGPQP